MRVTCAVTLVALTCVACATADLTLVQDGRPVAPIVLAAAATDSARQAAADLQKYLGQMSGAELPIVSAADAATGPRILVGASELTAALGYDPEAFALEQAIVRVHGTDLVIIGDDEKPAGGELQGTRNAAYMLLHALGCRWLWPGDLGTVLPQRATISVADDLNLDWTPMLIKRGLRSAGYNDRVQRGLDRLGWSAEDFQAMHREVPAWYAAHRIGGSFAGSYGHAFGDYWERFGAEHPEWFALQPDGTRDQSRAADRARLCVSNPELIAQIAAEKIAELQANPALDCVSISPNDGGATTFCCCPDCEAWDHPDGPIISYRLVESHVSLSDRYARFYNEIARRVARECPGRLLGAYAYSAYRTVPIAQDLEPNLMIGFVGLSYVNREVYEADLEIFAGWTAKAAHSFWRPNLLGGGMGFPQNFARALGRDVARFAAEGLTVTDFDCQYQHWALKGLTYYVLAEMLADPTADPDAIIDDYCVAGFGPAAASVRAYFDGVEAITTRVFADSAYTGRDSNAVLAAYYDEETLAGLQASLDAGRAAAAGDDTILARIDFLQVGIDYARVNRDVFLAKAAVDAGDATQRDDLTAATQAREDYYQQLGLTWAINAPYLKFYGF